MYSFDVFDTLITRKTAVPEGIFAIMQSELKKEEYADIPSSIRNNFYQIRILAERLARHSYQNNEIEDVSLEQIYAVLAIRGELSEAQMKQLARLECAIEYQECIAIEKNVAQVKKLLADGKTVILISDMYLPKEQIFRMLEKADPILIKLQLYVSGDCKKRKRTGAIYEFAMKQSRFTGAEWIHTGDNEKLDIAVPESMGICSKLSWFPALLPIERELLDQTPSNVWLNRVIGYSRRIRLELGKEMIRNEAALLGSSSGGILLVSYMKWVIKSVLAKGIKRLYFCVHEAYVLKRIADILIRKTGIDIETYYIYIDSLSEKISVFDDMALYGERAKSYKEVGITDENFAFVDVIGSNYTQEYLLHLTDGFDNSCFRIFYFGLEKLIVNDNYMNFVFYPGRIYNGRVIKALCGISENHEFRNYLAGIEMFSELFSEDGYMMGEPENMEQISKILIYINETSNEILTRFLCDMTDSPCNKIV